MEWGNVLVFRPDEAWRYPDVHGVVGITRSKTTRTGKHGRRQHTLIEDATLAGFLNRHRRPDGHRLWPGTAATFWSAWRRAQRALGLEQFNFTPAGLRGGGATDHFLRHRDIPLLRRRGRWLSERTLERYVQEGVFCVNASLRDTRRAKLVHELAALAPSLCR